MNSLKVPNNSHITTNFHKVDCFLDITGEVCPMTFVKTKLMLERLAPGAIAEVRLRSGEPLDNVPRSVKEDGHEVLSLVPEIAQEEAQGMEMIYRLHIRRA
ncbi:MAG: sulfurtransferase TusA family protein [Alphaproteobacteria bacterium]|nr:sulfurtransferase TusA family protein [Alphaproteobacteria bacterium]|tara:strand:- start:163 stop:465 length:303 start_codon:yes stop_codon:yes gene_type:complete